MGHANRRISLVIVVMAFGLVLGCGAKGVMPTEGLAKAETAVKSARTAEARVYAPLDLKLAEDKLAEAKAAAGREDFTSARRLADEARVNALLAEKKADAARAKKSTKDVGDTVDALRKSTQEPQK
ncbi:MAG TPA: hypothetical protein DCR97_09240 [Deltaproteobacteria bacterium]|nr:hypothetical protein [Deltaproteobacteria bacterium]